MPMPLPVGTIQSCPVIFATAAEGVRLPWRKAMKLKQQLCPLWRRSDGYHYTVTDKMFNICGAGIHPKDRAGGIEVHSLGQSRHMKHGGKYDGSAADAPTHPKY